MAMKRPVDTENGDDQVEKRKVRRTGESGQPEANDAVKFRARPDKDQYGLISRTFGCCRFYWNLLIDLATITKEQTGTALYITPKEAKEQEEWAFLKEIDTIALDNVKLNYHQAWKNHCDNPKHYGRPCVENAQGAGRLLHD